MASKAITMGTRRGGAAVRLALTRNIAAYRGSLAIGMIVNPLIASGVAFAIGSPWAWAAMLLLLVGHVLTFLAAVAARRLSPDSGYDQLRRAERGFAVGALAIACGSGIAVVTVAVTGASVELALLVLLQALAVAGVATDSSPGRLPLVLGQLAMIGPAMITGLLLRSTSLASLAAAVGVGGYMLVCGQIAVSRHRKQIMLLLTRAAHRDTIAARKAETVRLRTAMGFMSQGVLVTDDAGRAVLINDRFRDLLGLAGEGFGVGSPWQDFIRLSPRIDMKSDQGRAGIIDRSAALAARNARVSTVLRLEAGQTLDVEIARLENAGHMIVLRDVTDEAATEATLRREARRCPLTGLVNRRGFEEALAARLAQRPPGAPLALVLGDLKGFKAINDSYGHPVGDAVLIQVALWLQTQLPDALVCRLGGDEFGVIGDVADVAAAAALARRVLAGLEGHADIDGLGVEVEGRVGYAMAPDDADNAIDLLRRADMALLVARLDPLVRLRRFLPEQEEQAIVQLRQERALVEVLTEGRIEVAYQPIFRIDDGAATAIEALVRWPQDGPGDRLSAPRMVAIAEAGGLMLRLRRQVMEQAMAVSLALPRRVDLAVNISAIEMQGADFAVDLLALLASHGFDPRRLILEITESAIHRNLGQAASHLACLRQAGVRTAIDDFGTGFSSLAALAALPIDSLKVDRSLAPQRDGAVNTLLAASIAMARGLNLKVVAEGIETVEQLAIARDMGVDAVQGFLLAEPMPGAALAAALNAGFPAMLRQPRLRALG
ncbi:hypothetical protein IP88_15455 [alpha proteobacterium AAP81b]|nr:hypothetical protein IP88_15455 [alpha proteobacterium AAP81b]